MRKREILPDLILLLFLGIGLLLFFWPTVIQGKIYSTNGLIASDYLNFNYPIREVYRQGLLQGHLPWWEEKLADGYPLLAEGQLGAFYPPNLLFFRLLPTNMAINWLLYLHMWWAAIGTYFFMLSLIKSRPAATLSAISFALSGFMVTQLTEVNLFLTFSWFPWAFWLWWEIIKKLTFARIVSLTVIFALQILAGYVAIVYYQWLVLGITGLLFIIRNWRRACLTLIVLIAAIILSLGLTAIQIVPTWELAQLSSRQEISVAEAMVFTFPKEGFISFLRPPSEMIPKVVTSKIQGALFQIDNPQAYYAYLGILPFLLVPFGFFWIIRKKLFLPLVVVTCWVFLMTLGSMTPVFGWFLTLLPGMNYFRYSIRFLGFLEFFLAILAGLGLFFIFRKRNLFLNICVYLILGLTLTDLLIHQKTIQSTQSADFWLNPPKVIEKVIDQNLFKERVGGFNLNEFDLNLINNSAVQQSLKNLLPVNYNLLFGIASNRVHTPLPIKYHWDLISKSTQLEDLLGKAYEEQQKQKGQTDTPLFLEGQAFKLETLQGVKYFTSPLLLNTPELKLIWQFSFPQTIEEKIYNVDLQTFEIIPVAVKSNYGYLYQIEDAIPRAIIIPRAKKLKEGDDPIKYMVSEEFDPKEEILLEEDGDYKTGGPGTATILEDGGGKTIITAESEKGGWLYLSDTYYPGWKAFVDGQETKIYRANHAFRAVELPPGKHQVKFVYDPSSRTIGIIISTITLISILFFAFLNKFFPNLLITLRRKILILLNYY